MTTTIEITESGIRIYKNIVKRSESHSAARIIKRTFADMNVNKSIRMRLTIDQIVNEISA